MPDPGSRVESSIRGMVPRSSDPVDCVRLGALLRLLSSMSVPSLATAVGMGILTGLAASACSSSIADVAPAASPQVIMQCSDCSGGCNDCRPIRSAPKIHFDYASAALPTQADLSLRTDVFVSLPDLVEAMRSEPDITLVVEGHVDVDEGKHADPSLALRRAEAVRDWLVANGVELKRLQLEARGSAKPEADNSTPDRASNRRVEFHLELPTAQPHER
jgi:hypothetical protein